GAEARPAGDLVAGLDVADGRLVVDGLGVHAADEAQVIDHAGGPRQQLAHPHAALPAPLELELRRRDREAGLAAGHRRQPPAHAERVGRVLVVPLAHFRLVVVEVHLRGAADHVQVNHLLGLAGEVRAGRVGRGLGGRPGAVAAQERGQCRPAEGVRTRGEEVPPGEVAAEVLKEIHWLVLLSSKPASRPRRAPYLFITSSRFISWLTSIVYAAKVALANVGSAFDSPTAISCLASSACPR